MAEGARRYEFTGRIKNHHYCEVSCDRHISIKDLKIELQDDKNVKKIQSEFERLGKRNKLKIRKYLNNPIPHYPTPTEFHISEVTHVTNFTDLPKIMESGGFKANENLSWWSLKIDNDNIKEAEKRFLEKVFRNRSQEQIEKQQKQQFLSKFTTSPAFDTDKSRYGNFRFTFPLEKLMEAYKEQMCGGQDPVLREYKTMFYKQEIMYVVLVHSPDDNEMFENFPRIEKSPFIDYRQNKIVWTAQAIGKKIQFELTLNTEDRIADVEPVSEHLYVWDHVSLAFHFNGVLQFPQETLERSITCCKIDDINLAKGETYPLEEAKKKLEEIYKNM